MPGLFASRATRACLAFFAIALVLFTYEPQLKAVLDVRQDDHRILFGGSGNPLHRQLLHTHGLVGGERWPQVAESVRSDIVDGGRFRPATVVLEVLMPRALGTQPLDWHASWLLLIGATTLALLAAGRQVFGGWVSGTMFALLAMLGPDPGPAKTWYMMSAKAEAFGTLLVALSVLLAAAAARRGTSARARWFDVAALGAAVAAALLKEPFILILPALLALRIWLEAGTSAGELWAAARRHAALVVAYGGICILLLVATLLALRSSPPDSYGHAFAPFGAGLALTLRLVPSQAVWLVPAVLAGAALSMSRSWTLTAWATALIGLAWFAPQLVLYSLRGGMWDHYWLPGSLALAGMNTAALVALARGGHRGLLAVATMAVILWVANAVRVNWTTVDNFAARTHALQDAVAQVVAHTPAQGKVLLVADMGRYSEFALSWLFFLGDAGRADSRVYLYDLSGHALAPESASYFPHGSALDAAPCDFDTVVFLSRPGPDDAAWRRWYDGRCHEERVVRTPQHFLSLKGLGWTTSEFTMPIATRRVRP